MHKVSLGLQLAMAGLLLGLLLSAPPGGSGRNV
jgi:hypothetical protein